LAAGRPTMPCGRIRTSAGVLPAAAGRGGGAGRRFRASPKARRFDAEQSEEVDAYRLMEAKGGMPALAAALGRSPPMRIAPIRQFGEKEVRSAGRDAVWTGGFPVRRALGVRLRDREGKGIEPALAGAFVFARGRLLRALRRVAFERAAGFRSLRRPGAGEKLAAAAAQRTERDRDKQQRSEFANGLHETMGRNTSAANHWWQEISLPAAHFRALRGR